jgi:hypothetical protein
MSTSDLVRRMAAWPGSSQPGRNDPRLSPEAAPLEDRDTAGFLAAARALAAHVQRYGIDPDTPEGDWRSFFPDARSDLSALVRQADGRVPPHLALLIAWLDAAAPALRHVNGFTARHLQFQLQQVLGFAPQPAQPDRAHLVVELKKGAASFEIAAGQRFSAGKDGAGVERLYSAVRPAPIGAVRVAQLRSLRRDGERLLCAPQANSADGLGAARAGPEPRWPPFGPEAAPAAPVGFAVASALLQLAGGTRRIELGLDLSGRLPRHTDAALAASFEAFLTGAKGWIGPLPVTAAWQGEQLRIELTLGPEQAAVVAHDPAVHSQAFTPGLPVVQVRLRSDAALPFGALEGLGVSRVQLAVNVQGLRDLQVENDAGAVDARKAFLPFGAQPTVGASCFITCPEALSKRVSTLSLGLRWKAAPTLASHYAGYPSARLIGSGVSATLRWSDASGSASTTSPQDLMHAVDGAVRLGAAGTAAAPNLRWDREVSALMTSGVRQVAQGGKTKALRWPGVRRGGLGVTPIARDGALTLTLHEDFLHAEYRKETIRRLTATSGDRSPLNEPYTPLAQDIWIDYQAASERVDLARRDLADFGRDELHFFHVDAFGVSREHAALQAARAWAPQGGVTLLPPHAEAGELLIGLSGAQAGDAVSLLLQVAEGSADPLAPPQTLQWSVLADDAWRPLQAQEITLDSTRSLRTSGLLAVALPRETTTDHRRLDSGLVWLRAASPGAPGAACDLLGVHANAVEAVFVDQGNDAQHAATPLPAGSIAKAVPALAGAKAVAQPYASFGGALRESDAALARRAAERLRHRQRAISAWDAERLVLQAFPAVYRAKCVPHADGRSWLAAGHALMVVVPDLRGRTAVDPLQPRVDLDTQQRIHALLQALGGPGVQWHVANPAYRPLRLSLSVKLRAGFAFNPVRASLDAALREWLSPWARDPDRGPDFGGRVLRSVLLDFVEAQPGVDFVSDFRLMAGDDPQDLAEAVADAPDVILVSAPGHDIREVRDD